MRLYSDFAPRRSRQIIADLIALGLIGFWIWLGVTVYGLIEALTDYGRQMEEAGAGFAQTMSDVGENLGGVPVIGGGIRVPFDGASEAGSALEAAGQSQQEAIHALALAVGIGVAVLPVVTILLFWLIPRLRFAVRAGRASALAAGEAGIDLLALRALANQDLGALTTVDANPMAAWRRGDDAVLRGLAALELRSAGVRLGD